ncbi:MAG: TM0996/MTH895 family glutaredoxin-like protein [Planctomycetes bacterium]|nr:TM0996/MTH895 family glutaredoxin-like protein [Planctomycetota bacterium]
MTIKIIEVLGTGCAKCAALEKSAREAVAHLGLDAEVRKVQDMDAIIERGVMMTPALVVDGKVVSSGRALGRDEIEKLIR